MERACHVNRARMNVRICKSKLSYKVENEDETQAEHARN